MAPILHFHIDFTIMGKAIIKKGVVKSAANPYAFDEEKPIFLSVTRLITNKKKGNNKNIASKYFINSNPPATLLLILVHI